MSKATKGRWLNTGRTHFKKGMTPWNKGKGVYKNCVICNKEFYVWLSHSQRVKCCSRKCGYMSRIKLIGNNNPAKRLEVRNKISEKLKGRTVTWKTGGFKKGEDHLYWKGGISDQRFLRLGHGRWKKIAESIRIQQERICTDCGLTESEIGRKLSIHHLIPYRISKDDSPKNLIGLCGSCHRKREIKLLTI